MLRKFIWKGGKYNEKQSHKKNWNIVRLLKEWGGLAIKDPEFMNLNLGAKLVWRLLSYSKEWWKHAFLTKYFHKNNILRLEEEIWVATSTKIWKLCNASASVVPENVGWQVGNGRFIKIWKDDIIPSETVHDSQKMKGFNNWM